jgi:hypothetical protein
LEDKIAAVEAFWRPDGARFLISTSAGGEGINLQVCRVLFNYDLPWNPMAVEQRIGRIHRYGQQDTVQVYNFVAEDTVEQEIYDLLDEKLLEIAGVVGKVDPIQGTVVEDFRSEILGFLGTSPNYPDLYKKAILDRDYRRTGEELKAMLQTAAVASQALGELVQDLTAFNLENYRQLQGELTLKDLGVFVERGVLRLGGTCIEDGDFYRIETPEVLRTSPNVAARYETACFRRDVAMRRKGADLMGLGHPLVDAMIAYFAGPLWSGAVASLNTNGAGHGVSVRYLLEADLQDGSRRRRYQSVHIAPDGTWTTSRSKHDVQQLTETKHQLSRPACIDIPSLRARVESAIGDAESELRSEQPNVESVRGRVVGIATIGC